MPRTPALARQALHSSSLARLHAARATCIRAAATTTTRRAYSSPADNAPRDTHYDLFPTTLPRGPPPQGPFGIDARALRAEFLKQQAAAHPDRHGGGAAKRRAEALSARINEAYRVLADPLLRAQHVLALQGIDLAADEAGTVEDEALLLAVMEAREDIEDAEGEDDVRAVQAANEERLVACVDRLGKLLEEGDWDGARTEAVMLRYWVNIREACVAWEPGAPVRLQH